MDIRFPAVAVPEGETELGLATLRKISLLYLRESLLKLTIARIKNDICHGESKTFQSRHELPDYSSFNTQEIVLHLESLVSNLFASPAAAPSNSTASSDALVKPSSTASADGFKPIRAGFIVIVKVLIEARDIDSLMEAAQQIHLLKDEYIKILTGESTENKPEGFFRHTFRKGRLVVTWDQKLGGEFMLAVVRLLAYQREEQRRLSLIESLMVHLTYLMLMEGSTPHYLRRRFLGTPGFRHVTQTYMSLTDPGDGHRLGTSRKSAWMQGVIVHVEHLERPKHLPRAQIESYRVPSLVDFAKVRIHVGPAAPTTYFVGRMIKDGGDFEMDFLKAVHLTAAAITAAFLHGAAECKIAMDGLTARQAIRYMRALVAHVMRQRRQYLSCAFNINMALKDDHSKPGTVTTLTDSVEIADLAITLACEGGFDKVTWDGASDMYPSKCILRQLPFPAALRLVHEAHKSGLVTYFSAGFKFDHIEDAVYTGVDGVGIGGAQVLRYMDHDTGMHGPYQEENIDRILAERDKAASTLRGRGVALLCRLDRMCYEGSISEEETEHAETLFEALAALDPTASQTHQDHTQNTYAAQLVELKDQSRQTSAYTPGNGSAVMATETNLGRLLTAHPAPEVHALETNRLIVQSKLHLLRRIVDLPDDGEMPTLGLAKRLLSSPSPILANCAHTPQQWDEWMEKLRVIAATEDEQAMNEEYLAFPWTDFRRVLREPVVRIPKVRVRNGSTLVPTK